MTRLFFVLLGALALSACDFEQVIELDLPSYEPRLVVGGFPTPDSVFTARIGRSAGALEPIAFDGSGLLIDDAQVRLFNGSGDFLDDLRYVEIGGFDGSGGYYRSSRRLQPVPGQTYTLRAEAPGLPAVEATARIPEPVPFTVAFDGYTDDTPFGTRTARLVVTLPDPPGAQTYSLIVESESEDFDGIERRFLISFRSDDPVLRSSFEELDLAVDIEVELDPDRDRFFSQALFRDVLFEGETREIVLDAPLFSFDGSSEPGDLIVTLASLSDDYVRYQQTLALQSLNEDNPFAEPVRIHTNVEGGLGAFAGYSARSTYVDFDEPRPTPGRR